MLVKQLFIFGLYDPHIKMRAQNNIAQFLPSEEL
jgi:hypothetical protein